MNIVRKKRQVVELDERNNAYDLVEREETIKVYSGLYVNEAQDLDDDEFPQSLDQPDVVTNTLQSQNIDRLYWKKLS